MGRHFSVLCEVFVVFGTPDVWKMSGSTAGSSRFCNGCAQPGGAVKTSRMQRSVMWGERMSTDGGSLWELCIYHMREVAGTVL